MKTMIAFACVLLLAACSAPRPPAPAAEASPAAAPTAAATATATVPAPATADPMHRFRAFGTEPFWNVDVDGNTLLFTTPEDQAGQTLAGTRAAFAKGVEISGSHGGKPFVLTVRAGQCGDGMSDNTYAMDAMFDVGGQSLKGCAQLRE